MLNDEITSVLDKYGKIITDSYKDKISSHRASGNLESSVRYSISTDSNHYDIVISLDDYYKYLEYGRKPGKMPPIDSIVRWVRVKNITPKPYVLKSGKTSIPTERSLAFLIARSIGKKGMPAHNYMEKTLKEVNKDMVSDIIEVVSKNIQSEVINAIRVE